METPNRPATQLVDSAAQLERARRLRELLIKTTFATPALDRKHEAKRALVLTEMDRSIANLEDFCGQVIVITPNYNLVPKS